MVPEGIYSEKQEVMEGKGLAGVRMQREHWAV